MFAAAPLIPAFNSLVIKGHTDLSLPSSHLRTTPIPLPICYAGSLSMKGRCGTWGQSAPDVFAISILSVNTLCHSHNKRQSSFVRDEFRRRRQTPSDSYGGFRMSKGLFDVFGGCCHLCFKGRLFGPRVVVCQQASFGVVPPRICIPA